MSYSGSTVSQARLPDNDRSWIASCGGLAVRLQLLDPDYSASVEPLRATVPRPEGERPADASAIPHSQPYTRALNERPFAVAPF
jgi:hypothetical protein